MKLSTIGIGLLTVMVAINSYLNDGYLTKQDGSFKNGIIIDRATIIASVNETRNNQNDLNLYAFNSANTINLGNWINYIETSNSSTSHKMESTKKNEEPIAVEQVNSLVVYDIHNPEKNIIATKYEDFVDDIPLDNTNTLVSGFMQIMPRK